MITNEQLWQLYLRYVAAWNAIPHSERATIVDEVLEADIHYFTPNFDGGKNEVLKDMQDFQTKFPGGSFTIEDVSTHHDTALFTWVLIHPSITTRYMGHDAVRISPAGKIAAITTYGPAKPRP